MTLAGTKESLTLIPDGPGWRSLLRTAPLDTDQRLMREQLGLPTDAPVILTGHQAEFWHPGILAKYFAADAAARALKSRAAWAIVDHDVNAPSAIRYPTIAMKHAVWHLPPFDKGGPWALPTCLMPVLKPDSGPPNGARRPHDAAIGGLAVIASSLRARADQPNAARQVALAVQDLLVPYLAPATKVFATRLNTTDLFHRVVERILLRPQACIETYNNAAAEFPHAHIGALIRDDAGGRLELPLWRIKDKSRLRVFAHELKDVPAGELHPRALLLTALLRAGACDLFIHGFGGREYDRITDRWISGWMPTLRLAPTAVVSATRFLAFNILPPSTDAEVARAVWAAHHARHDPALLGDESGAVRHREILVQLRDTSDRARRATLFGQLHALLAAARQAHPDRLAALDNSAADARARRDLAGVAYDRTWPFPLYQPGQLATLKAEIAAAFGV